MNAPNATQCPPDSVLFDFGLGKLDAAAAETVGQHVETCAECQQRVAGISGDSFVGRLRQAGSAAKAAPRQRTYMPGESLANAANSTDGSSAREDGLPRPSRSIAGEKPRDGQTRYATDLHERGNYNARRRSGANMRPAEFGGGKTILRD